MVDLSYDDKIIETCVALKGNGSLLKLPALDYGIASVNIFTNNPSPKLIDQLKFILKPK